MLLNYHGKEFLDHPDLGFLQRLYVWTFGVPISGMRIRLRRVLPAIQGNFQSIIDLGCGKGIFSFELARKFPNAQVVGVDIDKALIDANNRIAKKRGIQNVRFEVGNILDLKYHEHFDLAVSVDNLEHIQDDVEAVEKISRALKPNGKLVCHVPAHDRIWIFRKMAKNFDVEGHVRPGYYLEELREKLIRAGLLVENSHHTYGYLETVSNNISYLITGAKQKNVGVYALAFPFLNIMAWFGRRQKPKNRGAGILAVAVKP